MHDWDTSSKLYEILSSYCYAQIFRALAVALTTRAEGIFIF